MTFFERVLLLASLTCSAALTGCSDDAGPAGQGGAGGATATTTAGEGGGSGAVDVEAFCQRVCECEVDNPDCATECPAQFGKLKSDSEAAGCEEEFDTYITCVYENGQCEANGTLGRGGCDNGPLQEDCLANAGSGGAGGGGGA